MTQNMFKHPFQFMLGLFRTLLIRRGMLSMSMYVNTLERDFWSLKYLSTLK